MARFAVLAFDTIHKCADLSVSWNDRTRGSLQYYKQTANSMLIAMHTTYVPKVGADRYSKRQARTRREKQSRRVFCNTCFIGPNATVGRSIARDLEEDWEDPGFASQSLVSIVTSSINRPLQGSCLS